eukprot:3088851-Prymnesium_polylepis.1
MPPCRPSYRPTCRPIAPHRPRRRRLSCARRSALLLISAARPGKARPRARASNQSRQRPKRQPNRPRWRCMAAD